MFLSSLIKAIIHALQKFLPCQTHSKLFYLSSIDVCDWLLYPPSPTSGTPANLPIVIPPSQQSQVPSHEETRSQLCGNPNIQAGQTLVGYYIAPSVGVMASNNYILFYPVWFDENSNNATETIGQAIQIDYVGFSSWGPNTMGASFTANSLPSGNIDHTAFEYNSLAQSKGFMKAYISWYELKQIANNCDFLGICGAKVNTGHFQVEEWTNGPIQEDARSRCPEEYFTYRFIGFKRYQQRRRVYTESPINQSNKKINAGVLIKSNQVLQVVEGSSGGTTFTYNHAIPTETWAPPCPPRWRP